MPQINSKAVLKDLEKTISPVLVVNNSSLKPYVEVFDYAPENIYQQPLGNLVGFFEVKEYSDDSAYIVNFLTSVLKKEYYINPKRSVTESLDSALHKVNLALSELAKHGNVEWLGKLNAAICVLEKNSTHFSVAGNAKMFLYRNQALTDISEDLASDALEPHPLKTFVNVSSGRLEKNDRLLITSEDIFHIFSFADLKKNFQRFEGEKFVQFLKTALSNQMEMVVAIVTELREEQPLIKPKKVSAKKKATLEESINVFSGAAFDDVASTVSVPEIPTETFQEIQPKEVENIEYTDKKTGHIYVQGESMQPTENSQMAILLETSREKLSEFWYLAKNETRRKYVASKKQIARKWQQHQQERARLAELKAEQLKLEQEEAALRQQEYEQELAHQQEQQRILQKQLEKERIKQEKQRKIQEEIFATQAAKKQKLKVEIIEPEAKVFEQQIPQEIREKETNKEIEEASISEHLSFKEKLALARQQQHQHVVDLRTSQNQISQPDEIATKTEEFLSEEALDVPVHQQAEIDAKAKFERQEKRKQALQDILDKFNTFKETALSIGRSMLAKIKESKKTSKKIQTKEHYIAPQFSQIKKSFGSFTTKQKKYTVIALVVIFIVPLFIVHFLNQPKKPTITNLSKVAPVQVQPTPSQKNMVSAQKQSMLSRSDILGTLVTGSGPVAYTKTSVLVFSNGQAKEYSITSGEGNIVRATFMSDLSLVLLVTDQSKVISFSPISFKFTDNNISLNSNTQKSFFGTYMTYLYVLDSSASQIYRYPRADGGFGEKTNWLKGTNNIANVSDMTLDESVWTVQNNQVIKYFKGQIQPISLEASSTPVHFDKIYTSLDCSGLWTLDLQNARLVEFSKTDGSIIKQYTLDELKSATSFSVDEKQKTAYAVTSSGLISISL